MAAGKYPTPEAAARAHVAQHYARVREEQAAAPECDLRLLAKSASPDEQHVLVVLGARQPAPYRHYEVLCERSDGGWVDGASGNSPGWTTMSDFDAPMNVGVATDWGEAPQGARAAVVTFGGTDHEVPVVNGYYLFVAWGVPDEERPTPGESIPVRRAFL